MMSRLRICSVGARAVLRGSSARFSPPSSPLLSFGLLLPGFATPVPSLARRCSGCFSLPGCSRVAPLLCKLTLCRVPLLTPSRFVPSCAIPSSPQPARSVPFPPDDGWRSSSESIWRGQRVPRALPGFVMCWGVQLQGLSSRLAHGQGTTPSNPSRCRGQVWSARGLGVCLVSAPGL